MVCCTQQATPDYPGLIRQHVEASLGGTAPCLFIQGAAGNVNPITSGTKDSAALAKFAATITNEYIPTKALQQGLLGVRPHGSRNRSCLLTHHPPCAQAEALSLQPGKVTSRCHDLPLDYAKPGKGAHTRAMEEAAQLEAVASGAQQPTASILAALGNLMNVAPGASVDLHRVAYAAGALAVSRRREAAAALLVDAQSSSGVVRVAPPPLRLTLLNLGPQLSLACAAAELFAETGLAMRRLGSATVDATPHTRIVLPVGYASPLLGYMPCCLQVSDATVNTLLVAAKPAGTSLVSMTPRLVATRLMMHGASTVCTTARSKQAASCSTLTLSRAAGVHPRPCWPLCSKQ